MNEQENVPMFIKADQLDLYKCAKLIDVRDPKDYSEGHINNAVNMHDLFTYLLVTSRNDDLDQMKVYFYERFGQLGINENVHVIISEQRMNNQYGASSRGFFIFKYLKHRHVSTLEGGLDAFIQIENGSNQINKEIPEMIPCQYNEQNENDKDCQMADRDEVLEMIKNKCAGSYLLDVRDEIEWNGLSSSPYGVDFAPRKGRISNAVWIE